MPITPLPVPGATPANWGEQLNDAIEDRVTVLQDQIDDFAAGSVASVNGETGLVTVDLVETPPGSFFYELDTAGS